MPYASTRFGSNASAGGWVTNDYYPRQVADVNGDGQADVVGFGFAGVFTALGKQDGTFDTTRLVLQDFGRSQGWTSDDRLPRELGDVNGDGRDDIVAFAAGGVYTALGDASGGFIV